MITSDVWLLFLMRLLIGMAVGADYPIATSLLAEFAPRRYRGPMLGGLVVMWFLGAAAAYVVGEVLLHNGGDDAWRWMLASAALPATVIVLLRLGTPESPRWLVNKGRLEEAQAVLHKVFGPEAKLSDLPQEEHRPAQGGAIRLRRPDVVHHRLLGAVISVLWAPETRGMALHEAATIQPKESVSAK